jgi:activator of 2-hydroxyglutaryl-CoA dehydratase
VGASRTKVVVIDAEGGILGYSCGRSGTDFTATADRCLNEALKPWPNIEKIASGAPSLPVTAAKMSPMPRTTAPKSAATAKGCFHYFPFAITIIDIGGQDNKIIKLDADGKRTSFKMNRKCAAGTGAFSRRDVPPPGHPLSEMNGLAAASTDMVKLGSFCTVFSATEVLENIRRGKRVEDIVKGLFFSVISRIREMDAFTEKVVMTGGVVAHNPYLVEDDPGTDQPPRPGTGTAPVYRCAGSGIVCERTYDEVFLYWNSGHSGIEGKQIGAN